MAIQFGVGQLIAVPTQDATGATIATPTPVKLGVLQEVSGDISFESKKLYGNRKFPVAIAQGKGSLSFKAKTADVDGAVLGSLMFGRTPTAGIKAPSLDNAGAVPASSPYTLTPTAPSSGTLVADLGVSDATTGKPMTRVAAAPAAGQYSYNAGVYTFAAADTGKAIIYGYEYSATSTTGQIYTLANDLMGLQPSFQALLMASYKGSNFVLKLNSCVASKFSLPFKNEDFTVPDFDFDASADSAGNVGYICMF